MLGVVARSYNSATGELVCWTLFELDSLGVADHAELASALSAVCAWASRWKLWCPGGLKSWVSGQAPKGAAQTGRVVQ